MQNVLSSTTYDRSHCAFPPSSASALFDCAATPLTCSRFRPPTPGISRSMMYRRMDVPPCNGWCGLRAQYWHRRTTEVAGIIDNVRGRSCHSPGSLPGVSPGALYGERAVVSEQTEAE